MSGDIALLVIDVQVAMFGEDDPIYDGDSLLDRMQRVIAKARAAGIPVIYVQHSGKAGSVLEPGTSGWPIHPAIAPLEGETIVHKRWRDAFQETNLQQVLESRGIKKLIVIGNQTEFCVDTTCRRAFSLGYDLTLVKDGHSTWDSDILTAQQIIAHHNSIMAGFARLKAAADIVFEEDAVAVG